MGEMLNGILRRGRPTGLATVLVALCLVGLGALPVEGATRWRSLAAGKSPGKVCIAVGEEQFTYDRLDDESPLEFTVSGPRRVKIITRYLYSAEDPDRVSYTVRVLRDGVVHIRKALSTGRSQLSCLCEDPEMAAGKIRRIYLDVPKGRHTYRLFVVEDDRDVAVRVYRQVKLRTRAMVSLVPTHYSDVYTLQFESGALSTYYGFGAGSPLRFEVIGPTKVEVCTRLEFDHTMNGSQSYGLEVLEDGDRLKVYRYHVRKMETLVYVERPEVLPGVKKCFTIRVPKGLHVYEVLPANGGGTRAAAKIYIPRADLDKKE